LDPKDLRGKTIYQRVFYRFSPGSDVEIHDSIVVEERARFQPDPEKAEEGIIQPMGHKTIILRDGNVEDGEIGDAFFHLTVHDGKKTHAGAGNDLELVSEIATAMYLASNPDLCAGKILEVACNLGLAGLLGCIGAGFVKQGGKKEENTIEDEVLTISKVGETLLPESVELLTLSDADQDVLNQAFHNVKESGVKPSKVAMGVLDWRKPKQLRDRRVPEQYQTIFCSDVTFTYPEAKELARTVANRLEASNPFLTTAKPNLPTPRFVMVAPDDRDDIPYLVRILEKGYRMSVAQGYLKLEKLAFRYQMLPESEPESDLDDVELELQEFKELFYQSLTAQHHPDYRGEGSGELFFPLESGEYDATSGSTFLEREWEQKGPW
jgi:hypothetical protein